LRLFMLKLLGTHIKDLSLSKFEQQISSQKYKRGCIFYDVNNCLWQIRSK
jgi:hypothetical protein